MGNVKTNLWPPFKRSGTKITQRTAGDVFELTGSTDDGSTDFILGKDKNGVETFSIDTNGAAVFTSISGATSIFTDTIFLADGTAASPSMAWTNFPTTGLYNNGGNQIAFAADGQLVAYFTSGDARFKKIVTFNGGIPLYIEGQETDTSDAVIARIGNSTELTTTGSRLLELYNNNVYTDAYLKAYVDYKGGFIGSNFDTRNDDATGSECLNETDFATSTDWTEAGDFTIASGYAEYNWTTGADSTITQATGDLAIALKASKWYVFEYDITYTNSQVNNIKATLPASVSTEVKTLTVNTIGTGRKVYFKTLHIPGDFVIKVEDLGVTVDAVFRMDNVSVKEALGGDMNAANVIVRDELNAVTITDGSLIISDGKIVSSTTVSDGEKAVEFAITSNGLGADEIAYGDYKTIITDASDDASSLIFGDYYNLDKTAGGSAFNVGVVFTGDDWDQCVTSLNQQLTISSITTVSGNGDDIKMETADADTSGSGGNFYISLGDAATSGTGGSLYIKPGTGISLGDGNIVACWDTTGSSAIGNLFVGTNTPGDSRFISSASTNDGTTYAGLFQDSDFANVVTINSNGDVVISGDLTVNGTTTTIDTTTLLVEDKNIEIGVVGTPSDTTADGGGITLKGATDKTIIWDNTNDNWTSNQHWNLETGLDYKINNVSVLNATTLGSSVVNSSLTSVGTLGSLAVTNGITAKNLTLTSTLTSEDYLLSNTGTSSGLGADEMAYINKYKIVTAAGDDDSSMMFGSYYELDQTAGGSAVNVGIVFTGDTWDNSIVALDQDLNIATVTMSSGNANAIVLEAADADDTGNGGNVNIKLGAADTQGDGGNLYIETNAGAGTGVSSSVISNWNLGDSAAYGSFYIGKNGGDGTSRLFVAGTTNDGTTDIINLMDSDYSSVHTVDTNGRGYFASQVKIGGDSTFGNELFHIASETDADMILEHVKDDGNPLFIFDRAKGDLTTKAIVGDGTIIGSVVAHGYDGVAYRDAANIRFEVDGTPAADDMPGKIMLSTSPAGATLPVARQTIYQDGTMEFNSVKDKTFSVSIADDGTIVLPTAVFGMLEVFTDAEYMHVYITVDGTVTSVYASTNTATTDSDTNLCVYDGGTGAVIKNRLGATKTIKYRFLY